MITSCVNAVKLCLKSLTLILIFVIYPVIKGFLFSVNEKELQVLEMPPSCSAMV